MQSTGIPGKPPLPGSGCQGLLHCKQKNVHCHDSQLFVRITLKLRFDGQFKPKLDPFGKVR